MEISKELLSELLELDVISWSNPSFGTYTDYNKIYVIYNKENIEYSILINIHEIGYKCKQWAYKQGYTIVDGISEDGGNICYIIKITGYSLDVYYEQTANHGSAVKACQWILDKRISK